MSTFNPLIYLNQSSRVLHCGSNDADNSQQLTATPVILYFFYTEVGGQSDYQSLVLTNSGTSPVGIVSITVTGEFEIQPIVPTNLLPGQSITANIRFLPTGNGVRIGDVVVNAGEAGQQLSVRLLGVGGDALSSEDLDIIEAQLTSLLALVNAQAIIITDLSADLGGGFTAALEIERQARIDGLVAEAAARAQALLNEAATRTANIQAERLLWQAGDSTLVGQINTVSASVTDETSQRVAAIQSLTTAYVNADAAEANQRDVLATQLRGSYVGNNLDDVQTGLIYQEKMARVTRTDALAQSISLLSAGVSGGFDPFKVWYFDTTAESWTATGATLSWAAGKITVDHTATDGVLTSPAMSFLGSSYALVKLMVKRKAGTGWAGKLRWSTSSHGYSVTHEVNVANPLLSVDEQTTLEWDVSALPDWTSNTIIGLQFELGSDVADIFEIDWIAVGRNAPGSSVAALADEAIARATADDNEIIARQSLSSKITGVADPSSLTLNDLSSGLLRDERVARTTADTAQVSRLNVLEAMVNSGTDGNVALKARIAQEETTRANQHSAQADLITSVSAFALKVPTGQLIQDMTFDPAYWDSNPGFSRVASSSIGVSMPGTHALKIEAGPYGQAYPVEYNTANNRFIACSPQTMVYAGAWLTWSGIPLFNATTLYIYFFDNAGNYLTRSGLPFDTAGDARWVSHKAMSPVNAAYTLWVVDRNAVHNDPTDVIYYAAPYLGFSEAGATIGAPAGTLVAGVDAASVVQTMSANTNDLGAIKAKYGVKVIAGKVAGFELLADGTTSDFIVLADRFAIENGAGRPFEVVGGTTFIKNAVIQDEAITMERLALNAATKFSSNFASNVANITSLNVWENIITSPNNSKGGNVMYMGAVKVRSANGGILVYNARILCDGIEVYRLDGLGLASALANTHNFHFTHQPAAGDHTYILQFQVISASSTSLEYGSRNVSLFESRR